ncbi:MAG: hypothetical protein HYV07_33995 [Deltaproteobacteria bacterium]|nr:hypothetical protein [Deltaproteobacteria bacterium]
MKRPILTPVISPAALPEAPSTGRVVLVDVAFANGDRFETATRPLIEELGERLALWVDHHDHKAWKRYRADPRFLLVDRRAAPACPELVTEDVVARVGEFAHLFAHADFDGCVAAAKVMRGGRAPYPEADEDARAVDSPGKGFVVTPRGLRLALAIERSGATERTADFVELFHRLVDALVEGREPPELSAKIDSLAEAQRARYLELERLLQKAEAPHPEIRVLALSRSLEPSDKKFLLRALEEAARIGVLIEREHITVATYDDRRVDLRGVEGLLGQAGFVWGRAPIDRVLSDLVDLLAASDRSIASTSSGS